MEGRPSRIVCLHGLGRDASDWDGVRPGLESFGEVVAPSLPRRFADAVAAINAAVDQGSVVVGHSLGGTAALRFAADTQRPLRALILTNCAFRPSRNGRSVAATLADYGRHRVAFVRELVQDRRGPSPRVDTAVALRSFMGLATRRAEFVSTLRAIRAPVLVLHTRDDNHVPVAFAMAAAAERPEWTLRILDEGGHHAHVTRPDAWVEVVSGWLRG